MRRFLVLVLLAGSLVAVPAAGAASAPIGEYGSGILNIPFGGESSTPVTITSDITVPDHGVISDLDVYVKISQPYVWDVQVNLTHVGVGSAVWLLNGWCTFGGPYQSGIDAWFDDEGLPYDPADCDTFPAVSGSRTPDGALSEFDGQDLNGTWRLTVSDQVPAITDGVLVEWGLRFTYPVYGSIVVKKVVPLGAPAALFGFDASFGDFSLAGGGSFDTGMTLLPGVYSVAEAGVPSGSGWSLVSAVCDDGSSPSAIGVSSEETVTCTFTNSYEAAPLCFGLAPTVVGTAGADILSGTPGRDVITGLGGDDVIRGLGGNDLICGGSGDDTLYGGAGNDRVRGGGGNDSLIGRRGDDRLRGGAGTDEANGGLGSDLCTAETTTACE